MSRLPLLPLLLLLSAPTHAQDRPREPIGAPYIVAPTPAMWERQGHCVCPGGVVVTVPALEVAAMTPDCTRACEVRR